MIEMTQYYIRRLKPLFLLFMTLEALLRVALIVREYANLNGDLIEAFRGFATGALFDLGVFAYFSIPLVTYLALLPSARHGTHTDRKFSAALYFILIYLMIFTGVAEWIFWDEFSTRFNFIAVDYLVYTQEVIGNIWESYPVAWLMSAITVVSALLALRMTRHVPHLQVRGPRRVRRAAAFAVAVVLAAISFGTVRGSFADFGDNRYWQEIARNGYFELFSAFRNNDLSYEKFYAKEDKALALSLAKNGIGGGKEIFSDDGLTHEVRAAGAEKHYNIMLITVESLSGNYFTAFGNKERLTPHLDQIADQSLFFTNLYATGTRTVYGLSAVNLSIPPIPGNSIVRRNGNEGLFSLGAVLNRKGYLSKFIYGGYGYFDNMNYFFENNGYQIVDRNNLTKEETTFANVWGVCDEDLFARALKEGDNAYASGKPFFNMLMTTSNHRPYTYPDGRIDIPSGAGRRPGGVKYTDYAIGKFIADARKKPWFDNTIFVIVADHTASSAGKTSLDPQKYHIPLIIYAPKIIAPKKVDKLASQIDLAPTLLGLMKMNYKSRFYGADLMKTSPERAYISTYQKLGYLTKDELVILEPVNKITRFKRTPDGLVKEETGDDDLVKNTIAAFQTASAWKTLSRDLEPQLAHNRQ
jgi:phosphoglycerol transferase MdoB-like AlkP superfamily enzyme